MFKETLTYTDFDGTERTEDLRFHLTKADVIQMELRDKGSFTELLRRIINAKDTPEIITEVDRLLMTSYGVMSPDGRNFDKSQAVKDAFRSSEMYSVMFMKLLTDDDYAAKFVNGIMPKDFNEIAAMNPESVKPLDPILPPTTLSDGSIVAPITPMG